MREQNKIGVDWENQTERVILAEKAVAVVAVLRRHHRHRHHHHHHRLRLRLHLRYHRVTIRTDRIVDVFVWAVPDRI